MNFERNIIVRTEQLDSPTQAATAMLCTLQHILTSDSCVMPAAAFLQRFPSNMWMGRVLAISIVCHRNHIVRCVPHTTHTQKRIKCIPLQAVLLLLQHIIMLVIIIRLTTGQPGGVTQRNTQSSRRMRAGTFAQRIKDFPPSTSSSSSSPSDGKTTQVCISLHMCALHCWAYKSNLLCAYYIRCVHHSLLLNWLCMRCVVSPTLTHMHTHKHPKHKDAGV